MTQVLLSSTAPRLENEFSVGICAADHAAKLSALLEIIKQGPYPTGFVLKSIIIVASGLDPKARAILRGLAEKNTSLTVVEEPIRRGKAEAINRILEEHKADFLVLVNSDAQPEIGAIGQLLSTIAGDNHVGMVSASPVLCKSPGITGTILRLMWNVHNECLLALDEKGLNNHCCDELIVLRSKVIRKLPRDAINDGAFLAGSAHRQGYSIKFCESAHVRIDVPSRIPDVLRQRRRIIYGHFQIRRIMGKSPRTMESMLICDPRISIAILIDVLRKSPSSLFALPVAVVGEAMSVAMAIVDTVSAKGKHVPWARFGAKS